MKLQGLFVRPCLTLLNPRRPSLPWAPRVTTRVCTPRAGENRPGRRTGTRPLLTPTIPAYGDILLRGVTRQGCSHANLEGEIGVG
jgi:hypothetical protein